MEILFVDDDRRVLSGLRRQLHGCNPDWHMTFAPGGPEGLQALHDCPPDVVVTDMKMPVVDGAQLLEHAVDLCPDVARLVLSGQADPDRRTFAECCAHRYLVKPCTPDMLKLELQHAVAARSSMQALGDDRVRAAWCVPPARVRGGRVLLAALDCETAVLPDAVLELLEADAILLSRLRQALAVLDEDGMGLESTPAESCVAFGARTLITTLLAERWHEVCGQADGRVWSRSVQTAVSARSHALAHEGDPAEAFLAGLLHATVALDPRPEAVTVLAYVLPVWGAPASVVDALAALPQALAGVTPDLPDRAAKVLAALLAARVHLGDAGSEAFGQVLRSLQPS